MLEKTDMMRTLILFSYCRFFTAFSASAPASGLKKGEKDKSIRL